MALDSGIPYICRNDEFGKFLGIPQSLMTMALRDMPNMSISIAARISLRKFSNEVPSVFKIGFGTEVI